MSSPGTVRAARPDLSRRRVPRRTQWTGRRAASVVALLPFGIFLLVFAVYPFIELIRLSLTKTNVNNAVFVSTWTGLGNFIAVLDDAEFYRSVGVTAAFVILTVLLSVAIGLALALLVDRAVILLPIARNALVWPAVVTPVVVSVIWLLILSPTVGVLNKALESLGLPAQGWINSGFGAFSAVVVIDVWHWTPLVFLFIYTALKGISPELYEAARTDGATERQTLFHVTLPLLRPALAIIMLLRTVQGVKAFDEMFLLTHGGPNNATNLISLRIRSLFFDQLNFGSAAATSLYAVIAVLLVVAVAVLIRNLRKGRVRG